MAANDSAKREKALVALLHEPSIAQAAKSAGIGEATLLRWLKEPEFLEGYRSARRELVSHAITQLQRASSEAVTVLRLVARDKEAPASARVSAARAILDTSLRAVEIEDLAARLDAVETALKGRS